MRFVSWNRAFSGVLLATALSVAPARADAQLANTGQVTVPSPQPGCNGIVLCDARWAVFFAGINNSGMTDANQGRDFATVTQNNPSVWAPNTPTASWIGVNSEASLTGGTGTGAPRVRYFFVQDFFSTTDVISFNLGWDNIFKGIFVNAYSFDGTQNAAGTSGYTYRDGTFFSAAALAAGGTGFSGNQFITLSGLNVGQMNRIIIEVEGDGTTDALFLANATQVVPEPATMTLLGSGLLAMGGAYRRRRQQQQQQRTA